MFPFLREVVCFFPFIYTEYYAFQLPGVYLSTDVINHYLFFISAASLFIGPHPTNTCDILSRGSSRGIKTKGVWTPSHVTTVKVVVLSDRRGLEFLSVRLSYYRSLPGRPPRRAAEWRPKVTNDICQIK